MRRSHARLLGVVIPLIAIGAGVGLAASGAASSSARGVADIASLDATSPLPDSEATSKVIRHLGLDADRAVRVAVDAATRSDRGLYLVPSARGATCMVLIGSSGNIPYGCTNPGEPIFENAGDSIDVLIHEEGRPGAPSELEVAGVVNPASGVKAVELQFAGGAIERLQVTTDNGFFYAADGSVLADLGALTEIVSLDEHGQTVQQLER